MYGRKKFTSIDEARLDIFLKKYKPNKNDNVLKGNIRKIDGGCWPPYFWALQEKILQTTLVGDICHNAFNSNTIPFLPENFGWNLVEGKYKIQWSEGDVSPTSIESACINDDEEELSGTECDSDLDIYILTVMKNNISV